MNRYAIGSSKANDTKGVFLHLKRLSRERYESGARPGRSFGTVRGHKVIVLTMAHVHGVPGQKGARTSLATTYTVDDRPLSLDAAIVACCTRISEGAEA